MGKTALKNQRLMSFSENADVSSESPSAGHIVNANFSKKYLLNKKLLSVGSWTGLYEMLIKSYPSQITAVDIENKALQVLKKRIPNAKVEVAFSHNLPFKDSSFDVITFWAVIEHIPIGYELATLKELRRVLKKEGILFLSTMNKSFFSDLLDPAYWLTGHRHYSQAGLEQMLNDSGFKVEKVKKHGGFIAGFDTILFYICKHIFGRQRPDLEIYHKLVQKDYESNGFYEIAIRAKAI